MRKPTTNMLSFTPEAVERMKEVLTPTEHVRVAVQGGGCAGMSYTIELCDFIDEEDFLMEFDHIKVYIDPHSASILSATTIDYTHMGLQSGFVFNNPLANATCGCGMSFA
jgi:iron-sulfur cluster assembly protein